MTPRPSTSSARPRIFQFLATFLCTWFLALALISAIPSIDGWAVRATIQSLATVARFLRIEWVATGSYVTIGRTSLEIVSDCTPLMPTLALWCAIFAFPAPWIWKAVGMIAGALLLWIYNLARVLVLALVLRHRPGWFEFVHAYLWQTVTLAVVLLMFLLWIRTQVPRQASA